MLFRLSHFQINLHFSNEELGFEHISQKSKNKNFFLFRKIAGFIYPVSVLGLIAMEGILRDETPVEEEILFQIFDLLRAIFSCLTVAMR